MSTLSTAVVTAIMVVFTAVLATAQNSGETQSCASKLTGCANYLNATTTPPSTCCNPLKEAITNEKACLCSIYNDPKLVQAFNINITQAKNLPKLCHIDTGGSDDMCEGLAKSPSSSTPSGSSPGNAAGNAAGRNTGTGLALAAVLFLFGVYSILY